MKYFESASNMILSAMKNGDRVGESTYKLMKSKFLEWKTAAANAGKELTDDVECAIIKKMIKEREESAQVYSQNGRQELADAELAEIDKLKPLLPAEPTEEDIENAVKQWMNDNSVDVIDKKQFGLVIKHVKVILSNADGKKISDIVKSHLA